MNETMFIKLKLLVIVLIVCCVAHLTRDVCRQDSSLYILRDMNSVLRKSSLYNNIVVDVYGLGGTDRVPDNTGQQCDFRLAIIRPYNWLWINMTNHVYRLMDDDGLFYSAGSRNQCRDPQSSRFLMLNDPRSGKRGTSNMKSVCVPFTEATLVSYFTLHSRHTHERIELSTEELAYDDGSVNEINILNKLILLRIFKI